MTQDRKDDIKGSREIEKSRKKADLSAAVDKEKTSSAEGLPAKVTRQVTHQVEASPKWGLAQPQEINSQNMTVHDPSVCVASGVFQVHS